MNLVPASGLGQDYAGLVRAMADRIRVMEETDAAALRAHGEQVANFRREIQGLKGRLSSAEKAREAAVAETARIKEEVTELWSQVFTGVGTQRALMDRISILTNREKELENLVRKTLGELAQALVERDLARGEAREARSHAAVLEQDLLKASLRENRRLLCEAEERLEKIKQNHLEQHIGFGAQAAVYGTGAFFVGPFAPAAFALGAGAIAWDVSLEKGRKKEIAPLQAEVDRLKAVIARLRAQGAE